MPVFGLLQELQLAHAKALRDEANGEGNHMLVLWPSFIMSTYTASATWYPGPDVWQGLSTDIFSCHPPAVQLSILLDQEYSLDTYVSTTDELKSHLNFSSYGPAPCLETHRTKETWKGTMVQVGEHVFQHQSSSILLWTSWGDQMHLTSCIRYVTAARGDRKLTTQGRAENTGK